jgi:hypothetical protein
MNKKKFLGQWTPSFSFKMASRNRLLLVWGIHVGGNGVLFFAMGKKKKKIKGFQSCLPTLPAYFPLKLAYGQFLPKIPGPVSQTKLKKYSN